MTSYASYQPQPQTDASPMPYYYAQQQHSHLYPHQQHYDECVEHLAASATRAAAADDDEDKENAPPTIYNNSSNSNSCNDTSNNSSSSSSSDEKTTATAAAAGSGVSSSLAKSPQPATQDNSYPAYFTTQKIATSTSKLSYTLYQLELLNAIYAVMKYPNSVQKTLISKQLGITRDQVKVTTPQPLSTISQNSNNNKNNYLISCLCVFLDLVSEQAPQRHTRLAGQTRRLIIIVEWRRTWRQVAAAQAYSQ